MTTLYITLSHTYCRKMGKILKLLNISYVSFYNLPMGNMVTVFKHNIYLTEKKKHIYSIIRWHTRGQHTGLGSGTSCSTDSLASRESTSEAE